MQETEISACGFDFYFYSPPYHLKLTLPGRVVDTERNDDKENQVGSCRYDVDKQRFFVELEKFEKGFHLNAAICFASVSIVI